MALDELDMERKERQEGRREDRNGASKKEW